MNTTYSENSSSNQNVIDEQIQYYRNHQPEKQTITGTNAANKKLSELFEVKPSPKCYDCLKLHYHGTLIGNYWCKQGFVRLRITGKKVKDIVLHGLFSIDLSQRTCLYPTRDPVEDIYEFILTTSEADTILKEIVEKL